MHKIQGKSGTSISSKIEKTLSFVKVNVEFLLEDHLS